MRGFSLLYPECQVSDPAVNRYVASWAARPATRLHLGVTITPIPTVLLLTMISIAMPASDISAGFAAFDRRAQAGERLHVVFFGGSLTWGANASDPSETSYRAVMRDRLAEHYPQAHFRCRDAAIGGTGSQLGAFRLERDVLAHQPDLVFVDFTANDDITSDDPETLASYESILRRLAQAGIPVVQVAFPFRWNIETAKLPALKGLAAHRRLAAAYGNGWGDAVSAICQGVDAGRLRLADLWVTDGVHPHDPGYREFAAAAWDGLHGAIVAGLTPRLPEQPIHAATYLTLRRFPLATLPVLPEGWRVARPNLTAINHDWLMSRWLGDLAVVRNRDLDGQGKPLAPPRPVAALRLLVDASAILVFGEATAASGCFRVRIDGQAVSGRPGQAKDSDLFDANRWKTGNGHLVFELARGLDTARPHLVEIEPVFSEAQDSEVRIESLCVAGGTATVSPAP